MIKNLIQPFNGTYPKVNILNESFLLQNNLGLREKGLAFQKNKNSEMYIQDSQFSYYVYRITGKGYNVIGLVGLIPHDNFTSNFVAPHEQTLPGKESIYIESLLDFRVQMNPVLLFYRNNTSLISVLKSSEYGSEKILELNAEGVKHEISKITDDHLITVLRQNLMNLDRLYVADGHHRIKASILAAKKDKAVPKYCLSMLISADALQIGGINRCIKHDVVIDMTDLLAQVEQYFDIIADTNTTQYDEYRLCLQGKWYKIKLKKKFLETIRSSERLAPCIVERYLLKPVFSIQDQRHDQRLRFVPDSHGNAYIEKAISVGDIDVAISIPPISMDDLCYIADSGYIIPPHSTYLQPKALDGLICWEY